MIHSSTNLHTKNYIGAIRPACLPVPHNCCVYGKFSKCRIMSLVERFLQKNCQSQQCDIPRPFFLTEHLLLMECFEHNDFILIERRIFHQNQIKFISLKHISFCQCFRIQNQHFSSLLRRNVTFWFKSTRCNFREINKIQPKRKSFRGLNDDEWFFSHRAIIEVKSLKSSWLVKKFPFGQKILASTVGTFAFIIQLRCGS